MKLLVYALLLLSVNGVGAFAQYEPWAHALDLASSANSIAGSYGQGSGGSNTAEADPPLAPFCNARFAVSYPVGFAVTENVPQRVVFESKGHLMMVVDHGPMGSSCVATHKQVMFDYFRTLDSLSNWNTMETTVAQRDGTVVSSFEKIGQSMFVLTARTVCAGTRSATVFTIAGRASSPALNRIVAKSLRFRQ